MKYRQALPTLKKRVKSYLSAARVAFDLTRYQSGGGGASLVIVAWTDIDPGEMVERLLRDELLPKWLKELEVTDIDTLWQGLSIHLIVRQNTEPQAEARQWRFVRNV